MRTPTLGLIVVFGLGAAACRPDVAYGTYECGPEVACPEGQQCDETSDLCVAPPNAKGFTCPDGDLEPDNDITTAQPVGTLTCVSTARQLKSCLENGDGLDLYKFAVPDGCASSAVTAVLASSIAYEELKVTLTAADGTTVIAADTECASPSPNDARVTRCISAPVAASTSYVLRVEPTGSGACGGACAFNRYSLTVQLGTH